MKKLIVLIIAVCFLAGCTPMPDDYFEMKNSSQTIKETEKTDTPDDSISGEQTDSSDLPEELIETTEIPDDSEIVNETDITEIPESGESTNEQIEDSQNSQPDETDDYQESEENLPDESEAPVDDDESEQSEKSGDDGDTENNTLTEDSDLVDEVNASDEKDLSADEDSPNDIENSEEGDESGTDEEGAEDENPAEIEDEYIEELVPQEKEWTIIVYMAADNNLESSAIRDLNEMESADIDNSKINILVLLDRSSGYDASCGNWSDTRLFKVRRDEGNSNSIVSEWITCPELELETGIPMELDMASRDTLSGLISFSIKEFPAKHTGLVIWGHGSGFRGDEDVSLLNSQAMRYYASDNYSQTTMSLVEMKKGIEAGIKKGGKKLDFIGFDTCFSMNMETVYQLHNLSDFICGAPGVESADGWNYDQILEKFGETDGTAEDFCMTLALEFEKQYQDYQYACFSVIDCSKTDFLFNATDEFFKEASRLMNSYSLQVAVKKKLFDSKIYYDSGSYPCDRYLNLYEMAGTITNEYAYYGLNISSRYANLENALKQALYVSSGSSKNGVSLYPLGLYFATFNASSVVQLPYTQFYVWGTRIEEKCDFVKRFSSYVPTAEGNISFLDKLFYGTF